MSSPSPACTVNSSATPVDVSASSSPTIALISTAGVGTWFLTCTQTDESTTPAAVNATLVVNQSAKTATFTAPSGAGSACIFQSTVTAAGSTGSQGSGRDVNNVIQPSYTTTFKVSCKTSLGLRVLATNETTEGSASAGWISAVNAAIRTAGTATSGDGQSNLTLSNGLNSNIATAGLVTLRVGGPTAAFSVGGFAPSGGASGGQRLTMVNTTTQALTIVHEDASSTAANRINTLSGQPFVLLAAQGSAQFTYDGTGLRWVLTGIGAQYPKQFDVRSFGATGNGSTDDSTALIAADTAAAAVGGRVYLAPGTYHTTGSRVFAADWLFDSGSVIGGTVTFQGRIVAHDTQQIFSSGATVTLTSKAVAAHLPSAWWGATAALADCSVPINAALSAAAAAGIGVVLIPPFSMTTQNTILGQNRVTMRGCGQGVTTITRTTPGDVVLRSNTPNASNTVLAGDEKMTLVNSANQPANAPVWSAGMTVTSGQVGQYWRPTGNPGTPGSPPTNMGNSPKLLQLVSIGSGTTGSFEPTGRLFANTQAATPAPAITITVSGALVADHYIDVQIIAGGAVGTATFQYSVDGAAWSSTHTTASTFGITIGSLTYTLNFAAGTYQVIYYTTPDFRWSMNNVQVTEPGGGPTWQVVDAGFCYHDIAGSGGWVNLEILNSTGGVCLDQTENFTFRSDTRINGCLAGIVLANGASMDPDAATAHTPGATNVIRGETFAVNCYIGLVDHGGFVRTWDGTIFSSNAPIVMSAVASANYRIYSEVASLAIRGATHPSIVRMLFNSLWTRAPQAGQAAISFIGSVIEAGTSGQYVVDGTTESFGGTSGTTVVNGLFFGASDITTSASTVIHGTGGASFNEIVWGSGNSGLTAGQVICDVQVVAASYHDRQQGFNTQAGAGYTGGLGVGYLPDGIAGAALDVGGGFKIRPYNWTGPITFNTGATPNVDVSLEYGYSLLLITTVSGAFTINGLNSTGLTSGYMFEIWNMSGQSLTIANNDSTNEATAANRIHTVSGSNITSCNRLTLRWLGTDIVTTAGFYEVSHS